MGLFRNLNPDGRLNVFVFGLCQIGDGLVRVLSLGYLSTTMCLDHARASAKKRLEQLKRSHK